MADHSPTQSLHQIPEPSESTPLRMRISPEATQTGTQGTAQGGQRTPPSPNFQPPPGRRHDINSGGRGRRYTSFGTPGASQGTQGTNPEPEGTEPEQTSVWGTDITIEECHRRILRFLKNFRNPDDLFPYYEQLVQELFERQTAILNLDCANLQSYDERLYEWLVTYPTELIPLWDTYVAEFAKDVEAYHEELGLGYKVRPFNLLETTNLRALDPSDIERLVSIKGMVIRASSVIPELVTAFFQCAVCKHVAEPQFVDRGMVKEPPRCDREECRSKGTMAMIHNRCTFVTKQVVRIQETPDCVPEGQTPHTVSIMVFDELVDSCKPGDRVEVTGVFRAVPVRVMARQRTQRNIYKTFVDVVHIRKQNKARLAAEDPHCHDPNNAFFTATDETDHTTAFTEQQVDKLKTLAASDDIYGKLIRSLAPSIWELDDVKKGLLCQLFGGSIKAFGSSTKYRGAINVLLCGDPGTSKSQLLQYVHKIAPRGIYTSGRGSSAVGLTAYITKDPETRETVLESGALVLSDRGICCIDEFDKMSDSARSVLHEVMEQQTVSIAKAGIICSLNARTSVLASANPIESRYNPKLSVIANLQLPPTLLSRFDLIYLVLDKADPNTDRKLAKHLCSLFYEQDKREVREAELDIKTLAEYITYARQHVHPKLTDEASADLVATYVDMRRMGGNKKVITATPRQLESLIRISEALARMRFSETVEKSDVEEAARLLRSAMQQSAVDPRTGMIDMDLINTGVSASARVRRNDLMQALRDLLVEHVVSGSSISKEKLLELIKEQSTMEVLKDDFDEALKMLQFEGYAVSHTEVRRG